MKRFAIAILFSIFSVSLAIAGSDKITQEIDIFYDNAITVIENVGGGLLEIADSDPSPNMRPLTPDEEQAVLKIQRDALKLVRKDPDSEMLKKVLHGSREVLKKHKELVAIANAPFTAKQAANMNAFTMPKLAELGEAMFAGEGEGSTLEQKVLDKESIEFVEMVFKASNFYLGKLPDNSDLIEVRRTAAAILAENEKLGKELAAQNAQANVKQFKVSDPKGRTANCMLIVKGFEAIRGECLVKPYGGDDAIQLNSFNGQFFAVVYPEANGVARGVWNGQAYTTHAHDDLGELRLEDGCWVNDTATVCAY